MRYLFILVGLVVLCGCDKKPTTISGVYIVHPKREVSDYIQFDFRQDGTVMEKADCPSLSCYVVGIGFYKMTGNKIIARLNADVEVNGEKQVQSMTNEFIMEGNDLLLHNDRYIRASD